MGTRYLTKSMFNLAMECPTKLYYKNKPEYANRKIEDPFLMALAEGGFQVGALAKCYFPGGYLIDSEDHEEALNKTNELLKQDKVIIYEAAVKFENLFVRVDILIKDTNRLEIIEVKAKSFKPNSDSFYTKSGSIASEWQPYLQDVAYQKYVCRLAFTNYKVSAYLMMADKTVLCPTDGLNQKFKIYRNQNGKANVEVSESLTPEDLNPQILTRVNVDECCNIIYNTEFSLGLESLEYKDYVNKISSCLENDEKIIKLISGNCGKCEFKATEDELNIGLKSGYRECWKNQLKWNDVDFVDSTVLEVWDFRQKDKFIGNRLIKLKDINEEDINVNLDDKLGLSRTQRQWMQISKIKNNDSSHWIDIENLKAEMDSWIYPLHFIDFETASAPIPFNKGRYAYEGIAFQFSHHIVHKDGTIEHCGQYLNTTPGVFPNYEFIRKLKSELEKDDGSIFRYAAHENTFLNAISQQIQNNQEIVEDREELCNFICTITKSVNKSEEKWIGSRNMIDMCGLVKRYYYDPATHGSNSIKYVLPAILNSSDYLKEKYSKPIYGAKNGIKSLNYKDWIWIKQDGDHVVDPYKLLPKMFQDVSDDVLELLSSSDELRNGGAALTAYARMQFEEMTEYERSEIIKALLQYCELDTMAMVMIYEGWKDMISNK